MKIAICTPFHSQVTGEYANSLAAMLIFTLRARPEIEIRPFLVRDSMFPETRNFIAAQALEWGADWTFWIDADQCFPEHALLRLLAHGKEIVGCNYARRTLPSTPTAQSAERPEAGEPLWTTREKAEQGLVEPALTLGMGFCLIHAGVFRRIRARFAEHGLPETYPVFRFDTQRDGTMIGEDRVFFLTTRELGITTYCDHALSWDVGHLGEIIFTNADTIAQRDAWMRRQSAREQKG